MEGRKYTWIWDTDHFELHVDSEILAFDTRTPTGRFGLPNFQPVSLSVSASIASANLDSSDTDTELLDVIIVTYLAVEQWRRQRAFNRRDPVAAAIVMS